MIKEYTNQLMNNETNHRPLTDAQPVSEHGVTIPQPVFPSVIIQHDATWSGIALWSLGISCPSCVPSQVFLHPQPTRWQGSIKQNILDLG